MSKTKRLRKFLGFRSQLWEWAFATRSSPAAHAWALSLSRAVCFPTPLSAACGCLGLMAGPSRPLPVGIFRVRPLRPVRTSPAGNGAPDVVLTRLQVSFLASAPWPQGRRRLLAGRWPCVTGLTSYLSGCFRFCSGVTCFSRRPSEEVSRTLPSPFAPRGRGSLARLSRAAGEALWRGGPAGCRDCVLVCAVATITLWGNCVGARVETPRGPDSARAWFLITPGRTVPDRV